MKSRFATSVIVLGMLTAPLQAQTVGWSVDSNHSDAFAIYSASLSSPAILFWLSVLVLIGFFLYPFIRVNRALKREEDRLRRHDPNEAETEDEDDLLPDEDDLFPLCSNPSGIEITSIPASRRHREPPTSFWNQAA